MTVSIHQLRTDGGTQLRAQIDLFTVNEYANAMLDGDVFPAVVAFYDGTDYWLADGFHRVEAAKRAQVELPVDVRQGSLRDAKLHSAGANKAHGLRRSNEDKRRAVMMLLADDEWRQWSDHELARRAGVSHPFVGKLRLEASTSNGYQLPAVRLGADGKVRDTTNIGGRRSERDGAESAFGFEDVEDAGDYEPAHPSEWATEDDLIRAGREALVREYEAELEAKRKPHLNVLSADDVEWYTPPEYIEAARDVLGDIHLDPASNPTAQEVIQAREYYTKDDNGLTKHWAGKVWLNPPWGRICGDFVAKLVDHYNQGHVTEAIVLLNSNSNETAWFQPLWDHTLCFTRGRINYYTTTGEQETGSTHGSVFVYLGPDWPAFAKRFAQYGNVVRRVAA